MFTCPDCGGTLVYDIESDGLMKCESCGNKFPVNDINDNNYAEEENIVDTTVYTCPSCGGEIASVNNIVSTFCPFCGGQVAMKSRYNKMTAPNKIIPYRITKKKFMETHKSLMSAWFIPNEFKNVEYDKIKGIYMPYFSPIINVNGDVSIKTSHTHTEGDYEITENYTTTGTIDVDIEGIQIDSSKEFDDALSSGITPFDLNKQQMFKPQYTAGFYMDLSTANIREYAKVIEDAANTKIDDYLECLGPYGTSTIWSKPPVKVKRIENAMLPTWFMTYRIPGGKVAYSIANGQTGKIYSDMPIDMMKYLAVSGLIGMLLSLFLLVVIGNTPSVSAFLGMCMLSAVLATELITNMISFYALSINPFKKSNARYKIIMKLALFIIALIFPQPISGIGIILLMGIDLVELLEKSRIIKNAGREISSLIFLPYASIVFTVIVSLLNIADDLPMFIAGLISILFEIVSFASVVKINNERVFRVPEQIKTHTGGRDASNK